MHINQDQKTRNRTTDNYRGHSTKQKEKVKFLRLCELVAPLVLLLRISMRKSSLFGRILEIKKIFLFFLIALQQEYLGLKNCKILVNREIYFSLTYGDFGYVQSTNPKRERQKKYKKKIIIDISSFFNKSAQKLNNKLKNCKKCSN